MNVGGEVPSRTYRGDQGSENRPVMFSRCDQIDRRMIKPRIEIRHRTVGGEWPLQNAVTCGDAKKGEDDDPCQSDSVGSGKRFFEPAPGALVMCRIGIDRVDENVDVDELHLRSSSLRAIS